jgi:hypothetical protein
MYSRIMYFPYVIVRENITMNKPLATITTLLIYVRNNLTTRHVLFLFLFKLCSSHLLLFSWSRSVHFIPSSFLFKLSSSLLLCSSSRSIPFLLSFPFHRSFPLISSLFSSRSVPVILPLFLYNHCSSSTYSYVPNQAIFLFFL